MYPPLDQTTPSPTTQSVTTFTNSAETTDNNNKNITILSACQMQQQNAEDSIANKQVLGAFVPQCHPDGAYKPVQCHALTGFCWCVDGNGNRVQGTEERFKMPNCEGP